MASWNLVNIGSGKGLLPASAKPLPQTILTYLHLDPQEYISTKFWSYFIHLVRNFSEIWIKMKQFLSRKCSWNGASIMTAIFSGLNVLIMFSDNKYSWCINSLWPSEAIWWQGSRSTLVHIMACCLKAPSHYLNQCWLIITKVQWCSSEGNFAWDNTAINH